MEVIGIGAGGEVKAVFWPGDDAGGFLVYLNGLESNHSWFSRVAVQLARSGVNVVALDRRGSGINQGCTGKTRLWLGDVNEVVAWIRSRGGHAGIHLGSLCYGALLATAFALGHVHLLSSLIYISPGLRIRVHPPFFTLAKAAFANLLGRSRPIPSPVKDVSWFTGRPGGQEWIRCDPLRKNEFSLSEFAQTLVMRWLISRGRKPADFHVLVLLAENDRIIDKSGNILMLRRLFGGKVQVKEYPATTHCLFFEPEINLAGDISAWISGIDQGSLRLLY